MGKLTTEQNNPRTTNIDRCSIEEMLEMINREDQAVPAAVNREIPHISRTVEKIASNMRKGGRLIYVGAGTSGRLGILDASECPPTYGTQPGSVIGIIAGAPEAILQAVEGIEDDEALGAADIRAYEVSEIDSVVGITASGCTPYVLAALREAKARGAFTVGVCNTENSMIGQIADINIAVIVGPEVIMGSTRMKAGTAQKLVLNMLSTCTMIRLGKVYQNYMVDLNARNQKLFVRSLRMICLLTGVDEETAKDTIEAANGSVKTAILMIKAGVSAERAEMLLQENDGILRAAIESLE